MAVTIIKRSTLPILGKGQPGKPQVSVRSNGQITFTTSASKLLTGATLAAVSFDEKSRVLQIQGFTKCPKGVEEADLFHLGFAKKSHVFYFAGAGLLQILKYDYKKSGNQNFDLKATDEAKKMVQIVLPEGALKPKPVTKRVKKDTPPAVAAAANGKPSSDDGPELEEDLEEVTV